MKKSTYWARSMQDIYINILHVDSCRATHTVTSHVSETKAFNHKADNELLLLFLNISVCVDQACPSLNKTPA